MRRCNLCGIELDRGEDWYCERCWEAIELDNHQGDLFSERKDPPEAEGHLPDMQE